MSTDTTDVAGPSPFLPSITDDAAQAVPQQRNPLGFATNGGIIPLGRARLPFGVATAAGPVEWGEFMSMQAAGVRGWCGAGAIVLAAGAAVAQTPPPAGYDIVRPGFVGPGYEYTPGAGGGLERDSHPSNVTPNGTVIGSSSRYGTAGQNLGGDAWVFRNGATQLIGLVGGVYERAATGGTFRVNALNLSNEVGQVAGRSYRFGPAGAEIGFDNWFFNGASTQLIGLTGGDYEYAAPGGGNFREGTDSIFINNAGHVLGGATRFNSAGANRGDDAWFFDGATTKQIGLTGPGYEYILGGAGTYRASFAQNLGDFGHAAGQTTRYAAGGQNLGVDAWRFDGNNTSTLIGFTGAGYEYPAAAGTYRLAQVRGMNGLGDVVGYTERYTPTGVSLGRDAWVSNGVATQQVGLTGGIYQYTNASGTGRASIAQIISNAGHVAGNSARYSSTGTEVGRDVWIYDGTTTHAVALTGSPYEYTHASGATFRSNVVRSMNESGEAVGYSLRYSPTGAALGQDVWYSDGAATQRISLTGGVYEYTSANGVVRNANPASSPLDMINDDGQVIGSNNRYTVAGADRGKAGWFFDPATDLTSELAFSFNSTTGYSWTDPQIVTDEGVVLGSYRLYSGSTSMGDRAFWWSLPDGFHDLGALIDGSLAAEGFAALVDVEDLAGALAGGSPQYLIGSGLATGQTAGETAYLLVVPEPATATLAAFAVPALTLLARRRRYR